MEGLLDGAIPLLERSLRFRVSRQAALASNVANADTPGYRRVDLRFDALLEGERARMARTHEAHLPTRSGGSEDYRLVRGPRGTRPDGNGVELESELVAMSRNAGAFTDQASVLSRLLGLRRIAVTGRS